MLKKGYKILNKKIYTMIIPIMALLSSSCSWFDVPPPGSIAAMAFTEKQLPRMKEVWNHCQAVIKDKSLESYLGEYEVCKNQIIPSKYKALYMAVGQHNWPTIRYLVEEIKVDVNMPYPVKNGNQSQTTALILAAEIGYNDIVEYLLSKGASINKQSIATYSTPFQSAVWKKRSSTAILLLERGADPYHGYRSKNKDHFFKDVCEHVKYQGMNELLPYLKKCQ